MRSKNSNYLSTSVDRIGVLEMCTLNVETIEEEKYYFVTAVEIKCMTTKNTKNDAIERYQKYGSRFIQCNFGDETFKDLVWTSNYRAQCLHHICTLTINHLLFVVGSTSEILYICLVTFPNEIILKYKEIIETFGDRHVRWYQIDRNIERTLQNVDLKHAVDVHTINFWRNMGLEIVKRNRDERFRLTPAHEIVPETVCLWIME